MGFGVHAAIALESRRPRATRRNLAAAELEERLGRRRAMISQAGDQAARERRQVVEGDRSCVLAGHRLPFAAATRMSAWDIRPRCCRRRLDLVAIRPMSPM